MKNFPREILEYQDDKERCPFLSWINSLRDVQARAIIRKRLNRIRIGNLGIVRNLADGVWEIKIDFGPGYRIYYGEEGKKVIVLLCAGDKKSQNRDILMAKKYWKDYVERL